MLAGWREGEEDIFLQVKGGRDYGERVERKRKSWTSSVRSVSSGAWEDEPWWFMRRRESSSCSAIVELLGGSSKEFVRVMMGRSDCGFKTML